MNIERFTSTLNHYTLNQSESPSGEITQEFQLKSTFLGAMRLLTQKDGVIAGKEGLITTHRLYTQNFDIKFGDRVGQVINSVELFYEVISPNDVMQQGRLNQVELRLIL